MDLSNATVSTKTFERFVNYVLKMEPEEFYGLCIIMGISIVGDDSDPQNGVLQYKEPDLLLEEVLDTFCFMERQKRKNLMRVVSKSVKGR